MTATDVRERDEEQVTASEPAPPGAATPRAASGFRRVLALVLGLALVASVGVLRLAAGRAARRGRRAPAAARAGDGADAPVPAADGHLRPRPARRPGAMPAYRDQVGEVITPKFKASFEKEAGVAEQLVAQSQAARVAEVFATGVSDIDPDSATALVAGTFTDTYVVKDEPVEGEPVPFRIEVSLVRIDGDVAGRRLHAADRHRRVRAGAAVSTTSAAPSLYDLLDVAPDASAEEIRAAWRSAIDGLEPGDRRFRAYNAAAEALLDRDRRAAYDAELAADGSRRARLDHRLARRRPRPAARPAWLRRRRPAVSKRAAVDGARPRLAAGRAGAADRRRGGAGGLAVVAALRRGGRRVDPRGPGRRGAGDRAGAVLRRAHPRRGPGGGGGVPHRRLPQGLRPALRGDPAERAAGRHDGVGRGRRVGDRALGARRIPTASRCSSSSTGRPPTSAPTSPWSTATRSR